MSKWGAKVTLIVGGVGLFFLLKGCEPAVIFGAVKAGYQGKIIDNGIMAENYPKTFKSGSPQFIERDFEAGAELICDEVELNYGRDLCAEYPIRWRR